MKTSTLLTFLVVCMFIGTVTKSYAEDKKREDIEKLESQIKSYYHEESYGNAIIKSLELLALSQEVNDVAVEVSAYVRIAAAYSKLGEYEMALSQLTNAIQLNSAVNNQEVSARLYTSISKLLIDLGRYDEALKMVKQGLSLVNSEESAEHFFSLEYNHATILMMRGSHSEALSIYSSLRDSSKKEGDLRRYAEVENNIGMLQKFEKNYTEATRTFNLLLNYAKKHKLLEMQVYSLLELGDINRILKRFSEGRDQLKKIDNLFNSDTNLHWVSFQLSYLLALEKDAGNNDLAFEYQTKLNELKPKLSNVKILNRIELMKTNLNIIEYKNKVTLLEKDKQLSIKNVELQKLQQRNMLLVSAFLLVLILAFAFYQNRRRHTAMLISQLQAKTITDKNKLLADVSHELRTPLTVLKLQVEALQHNLDDDVEASYQALDDKISDISRLISDIYQLAKSDIGALDLNLFEVEFPEAINHYVNEFELLATSNNLTWQFKNQLKHSVSINADSDRIKQVLCNLINNSVKYTDKPGTVSMSISSTDGQLFIIIEDSSPSVPQALQSQIFERLYRVEESRNRETGGSGLGLAICRSLIEAHNGLITANTSDLGGLKITIQLPLC